MFERKCVHIAGMGGGWKERHVPVYASTSVSAYVCMSACMPA